MFELASILGTFSGDSNDPWETLLQDPTVRYIKREETKKNDKTEERRFSKISKMLVGENSRGRLRKIKRNALSRWDLRGQLIAGEPTEMGEISVRCFKL